LFQVLTRDGDHDGPYRLMVVFAKRGQVVDLWEERSLIPTDKIDLVAEKHDRLAGFHLPPAQYEKAFKIFRSVWKVDPLVKGG